MHETMPEMAAPSVEERRVPLREGHLMNVAAAERLMHQAAEQYNAGRSKAAETICTEILAAHPDFIPALHLGAVIALASDRMPEGTNLLSRLFALDPNHVPALVAMGDALSIKGEQEAAAAVFERAARSCPRDAGIQVKLAGALMELSQFAHAESAYRRAIELDPNMQQARFNLGVLLMKQKRLTEAETSYRRVVEQAPSHWQAWLNLGNVLVDLNKHDEAILAYRETLNCQPNGMDSSAPLALANLAGCLCDLNRIEEAILACRQAIAICPDYAPAYVNLGVALNAQRRFEEAIAANQRAIEIEPNLVKAHANLAVALRAIGRFDEAIDACQRALQIEPSCAESHTNLGLALGAQGSFDEALVSHRRAIEIAPNSGKAYSNLAVALRSTGRLDEALAASRRAVELEPSSPEIRFNHAHALLMNGHYETGFDELRWGRICKPDSYPSFEEPEWHGERFQGRTLLLFAEAGLGDTLQFVRYLPMVVERGGSIILQIQSELAPLLKDLRGVTIISKGEPLPPFDMQLPLMRLPHIFGTTLASIPAPIPYLHADPDRVTEWRNVFREVPALKVGMVWAGNPRHQGDRQRSIAADAVLPRFVMPGVQLYSLQKEPRAADIPVLEALERNIIDLGPRLHDFADTAAAVTALDLVISVDTSVAHLAGALGGPVWVLLPYALDWRWLRDRDDTPWYPNMRLFRQERPRTWESALTRASEALAQIVASSPASAPGVRSPWMLRALPPEAGLEPTAGTFTLR
jgi:tetratricopeptide (TPR) repeat protein